MVLHKVIIIIIIPSLFHSWFRREWKEVYSVRYAKVNMNKDVILALQKAITSHTITLMWCIAFEPEQDYIIGRNTCACV